MSETEARAVVYEAPEQFAIGHFPLPELGPEDMLLKVELAGLDGSDIHMFRGEFDWLNERAPVIFGDEMVGRVAAIGDDAAARRDLAVGDLIAVEARWPCGHCRVCREGNYYMCESNKTNEWYGKIGSTEPPHLMGAFASHVFVPPPALAYRIPEAMPMKTALFAYSVLANGIRWTKLPGVEAGSKVAVIGPGPQGLACVLAAAQRGADVVAIGLEQDARRLEVARSLGAVAAVAVAPGTEPAETAAQAQEELGEVDVVIDTAGTPSAKATAFALVRKTGTIVNAAIAAPFVQPVDWTDLIMREVTLLNPISHPNTVGDALEFAAELLAKGIDVGDLISDVYPLEEAERAVRAAAYEFDEVPIKVALDPAPGAPGEHRGAADIPVGR